MNTKGSPPPYNTGADVPLTSQPNRDYNPQPVSSPFQPPALTTTVNVSTARAKGSCPVCQGTSWTGSYSCCAWLLCIFCFPCGIICCCCMRNKKCTKCGFTVG